MFQESFPSYLLEDVNRVEQLVKQQSKECNDVISQQRSPYLLNGDMVYIPDRIYYQDANDDALSIFNERQKMILHCIYSRNHNGYIREKHIKALLSMDYQDWVFPYIVKVCDEYVVEILETVYIALSQQGTEAIKRFCAENLGALCKGYARMASYWNEFYSFRGYMTGSFNEYNRFSCRRFRDYIGRKLFIECFGYTRSMERRKMIATE